MTEGNAPRTPLLTPEEIATMRAMNLDPAALEAEAAAAPAPAPVAAPRREHSLRYLLVALAFGLAMLGMVGLNYFQSQSAQKQSMNQMQTALVRLESRLAQAAAKRDSPAYIDAATITDAGALTTSGNIEARDGNFAKALGLFKAAIAADRSGRYTEEAHFRCAQCLFNMGEPLAAIEEYRLIIAEYRGGKFFAAATVEAARLLMDRREFLQARRLLYQLTAMQARMTGQDLACIEQAWFAIAACYEGEAGAVEQSHTSLTASLAQ